MTSLVLTVVGDDRAGLVASVAELVGAHGGNWERSQLAELAGAFAGVIEVSVEDDRAEELRSALAALDGLLAVNVHTGATAGTDADSARHLTFHVLGNDRPGIVRDISAVLRDHDLSIEEMTTGTREAAMFGGRLFEADVIVRVPASVDPADVTAELERLANEIQVDVSVAD